MTARKLFLSWCVTSPDDAAEAALRAAPEAAREEAARLAVDSGFGGLFRLNVTKRSLEGLFSEGSRRALKDARSETMRDGLALLARFAGLADAMEKRGARCVPLKGVSLAMRVYPDEGCRRSADLDVLVDPEGFAACADALAERGYRPAPAALRGVSTNLGQERAFKGPDGDEIDVHYRLFPWYAEKHVYRIDSAAMRARVERERGPHREASFLKKEDELHYLFLSAAATCGAPRYLLDADAFTRALGAGLDWASLERALFASPLSRAHAAAAIFMREELGTPFPETFLARARGSRPKASARVPGAASVGDAAAVAGVYLRWNAFKRFGLFRGYFLERNNPAPEAIS